MRESKFKFVFKHPDGEVIITPGYTIDEILQTSIEDIQDTWINCDCVPIGECNYVECNCSERFDKFKLIDKLQFTGLKDKNGTDIYEGDILNHSNCGNYINRAIDYKDGGFMITSDEGQRYYPYGAEVIGNLYESPQLLTP